MYRVEELGTILSIWAHPDDETYLAGGVMAAAAAAGQRVVCVSATAGEHGTADPEAWPPERLDRHRRAELRAAMAVLGVEEHHVIGWEDGGLHRGDHRVAIGHLTALLDTVDPDTILTFGPDGMTFHPDHCTLSAWVRAAWDRRGRRERLLQAAAPTAHYERFGRVYEEWGIYMSERRPRGYELAELALHLDLPDALLDRKVEALRAMASQVEEPLRALGVEGFRAMNATESFIAA